jgi:hypothetical protein
VSDDEVRIVINWRTNTIHAAKPMTPRYGVNEPPPRFEDQRFATSACSHSGDQVSSTNREHLRAMLEDRHLDNDYPRLHICSKPSCRYILDPLLD